MPGRGAARARGAAGAPRAAGTSCSASSWYRAVSSSSRSCFLSTSSLEVAPRAVPTHLYRKLCSKARGCGCADPGGRGSAARAVGNPGQRPLRTEQVRAGRGLRGRRWAQWLLHLPARATRAKRQTRAAGDPVEAQGTGPRDHVQNAPAGCAPTRLRGHPPPGHLLLRCPVVAGQLLAHLQAQLADPRVVGHGGQSVPEKLRAEATRVRAQARGSRRDLGVAPCHGYE